MKELKLLAASTSSLEQGPDQTYPGHDPHSVAFLDDITPDTQYTLLTDSYGPSQPSEAQYRHASPTSGLPASQIQGVIARVENFVSQQYVVSSPTP